MDPIKAGSATAYTPKVAKTKPASPGDQLAQSKAKELTKVEDNKVTLSPEGKALLSTLQKMDNEGKAHQGKSVGEKVESFTYGALGMEHPDKLKEEKDDSYSAGQYLSAAATIGSILLAIA